MANEQELLQRIEARRTEPCPKCGKAREGLTDPQTNTDYYICQDGCEDSELMAALCEGITDT